ncbi:RTA1-domain-containing protein [Mycena albidolilacea]|uniref:RTA1-domain-containing protein n=1 Tax=Mycena albidolilacea TaxID=1033008 RepID=A0AAD6ZI83_9AGAR|nr:RTA1-domain-containing protein [Mycena albidolilacea]
MVNDKISYITPATTTPPLPPLSLMTYELFPRSGPIDVEDSQYGYIPHEYVAIIFVILFGISTILHIGQATYYRMWWLLPTACLCGLGELVGWSGRLWSSFSPSFSDPYMMQITSTIISPTPLIAVNFILLSWIVTRLGPCYARLTPIWYTILFLSCDILALVIQGAGGGIASSANTLSGANLGANIMLAGIVFQFAAIITYSALAADFLRRYHVDRPVRGGSADRGTMDTKLKAMIAALAFSTLVLFIRSIYRIIELSTGWHGRIIETEVYFNVLDGGMVILAIFTMNFAHPGRLLGSRRDAYATKISTPSQGSSTETVMAQV